MYTTLDFLKSTDACAPGFGRMLRFFGTTFDRHTRIPLHVVALVGGHSDADWVRHNSLIIDHEEYLEFRKRTIVHMMRKVLLGEDLLSEMHAHSVREKLPFAAAQPPRIKKRFASSAFAPSATSKEVPSVENTLATLTKKLHGDLWHVLGFDNENETPPPYEDVTAFIAFVDSLPESCVPRALRNLFACSPREYIKTVLHNYREEYIGRNGTDHNGRLLFTDERKGTNGYIYAKVLQPVDTLKFLSTMSYKPRINADTKIEHTSEGRVRFVHEVDIESLEYLMLVRAQTERSAISFRDQDNEDNETGVDYPEYELTSRPVSESSTENVYEYAQVPEEITRPAGHPRVLEEAEEEEEEDDDAFA